MELIIMELNNDGYEFKINVTNFPEAVSIMNGKYILHMNVAKESLVAS